MKTSFKQFLLTEMPQHYKGDIAYQKDTKFLPVSKNNIGRFIELGQDEHHVYYVHPELTYGYVFNIEDLESDQKHIRPIMSLQLRDSGVGDLRQPFRLRIMAGASQQGITKAWYYNYINKYGGLVSDIEHLEGGKTSLEVFYR